MVNDVINEMEREYAQKQPNPSTHAAQAPPQPMMHIPHAPPMVTNIPKAYQPTSNYGIPQGWIDKKAGQRALIAAIIAFALFFPDDLSAFYNKIPILSRLANYDRIIRALVLAVVLYLVFWKVEI